VQRVIREKDLSDRFYLNLRHRRRLTYRNATQFGNV
jgi:hypothetical protein